MDKPKSNSVIFKATSSSEAIRGLYEIEKQINRSRSLAYYCKRAGIPSTGYLSDVMSGKRTINAKYRAAIPRAFDLSGETAACLRLLIDIDNETEPELIIALQAKLLTSKKALNVAYLPLRGDSQELFQALDLFCAFGLFGNRATFADLKKAMEPACQESLERSLELLESLGLVKNDHGRFVTLQDHVLFGNAAGGVEPAEFLKIAIAHAAENVSNWFARKDLAYFTSTVASVRADHYATVLKEIKGKMLQFQSELASGEADMMVRFNVQIYPIVRMTP